MTTKIYAILGPLTRDELLAIRRDVDDNGHWVRVYMQGGVVPSPDDPDCASVSFAVMSANLGMSPGPTRDFVEWAREDVTGRLEVFLSPTNAGKVNSGLRDALKEDPLEHVDEKTPHLEALHQEWLGYRGPKIQHDAAMVAAPILNGVHDAPYKSFRIAAEGDYEFLPGSHRVLKVLPYRREIPAESVMEIVRYLVCGGEGDCKLEAAIMEAYGRNTAEIIGTLEVYDQDNLFALLMLQRIAEIVGVPFRVICHSVHPSPVSPTTSVPVVTNEFARVLREHHRVNQYDLDFCEVCAGDNPDLMRHLLNFTGERELIPKHKIPELLEVTQEYDEALLREIGIRVKAERGTPYGVDDGSFVIRGSLHTDQGENAAVKRGLYTREQYVKLRNSLSPEGRIELYIEMLKLYQRR